MDSKHEQISEQGIENGVVGFQTQILPNYLV